MRNRITTSAWLLGICGILLTSCATSTPIGSIIAYGGEISETPKGYLICDGQTYSIEEYGDLYATIQNAWGSPGQGRFNVPDLRGLFLRGANTSPTNNTATKTPDPDETDRKVCNIGGNTGKSTSKIGSVESDTIKHHNHQYEHHYFATGNPNNMITPALNNPGQSNEPTHEIDPYSGGSETRPKNAYVYYLIRAK